MDEMQPSAEPDNDPGIPTPIQFGVRIPVPQIPPQIVRLAHVEQEYADCVAENTPRSAGFDGAVGTMVRLQDRTSRVYSSYTGNGVWAWSDAVNGNHKDLNLLLETADAAPNDGKLNGTFQFGTNQSNFYTGGSTPIEILTQNVEQLAQIVRSLPLVETPELADVMARVKYYDEQRLPHESYDRLGTILASIQLPDTGQNVS